MDINHSKLKISFFSILAILLFVSCQQTLPELTQSNYSVIFDYKDEESLPTSRLSVFVESSSDVRRYNHIQVSSKESDLTWNIDEISRITSNGIQWAGNTNLVVPENQVIPQGIYELIYFNADDKSDKEYIDVSYDPKIYSLNYKELIEYMKNKPSVSEIIIYDAEGKVLYYGNKLSEFSNVRGIWNAYSNAVTYQDILCLPGRYTICILPEKKVQLEEIQ